MSLGEYPNPEHRETLPPGYKILLSGVGTLIPLAAIYSPSNPYLLDTFIQEYIAICDVLKHNIGQHNVIISDIPIFTGHKTTQGHEWKVVPVPEEINMGALPIPFLKIEKAAWPRDAFTLVGDSLFVDPAVWTRHSLGQIQAVHSLLGKGGKVLPKNRSIIVTPDIERQARGELENLKSLGYQVGTVPFVDANRQKVNFVHGHIDGHVQLVETRDKPVLIVAYTYAYQDKQTLRQIDRARVSCGVQDMYVIDDMKLPPLALNFIQLYDQTIIMTSGAPQLEDLLKQIVGFAKVKTTSVSLHAIPRYLSGSIRCMTNILPPSLVRLI